MARSFRVVRILFVSMLIVLAHAGENDDEDDERETVKNKYDGVPLYKRPMDLNIRALPFFTMFMKRPEDGPAKMGFQVFPDLNNKSGLVNLSHKWFK